MRKRLAVVLAIVAFVLLLPGLISILQSAGSSSQQSLALQRPPFMNAAIADENSPSAIGDKLDQEAGIAAYYKSPNSITLSQVRGAFRTIEDETANYIIGSVPFQDHAEKFDVHTYVHKDGWILAYYLKADPASKIADVKGKTVDSTKLYSTVSTIAGLAGVPFSGVTYYDFRYPNANSLMLIGEDYDNGNDFTIELPTEFGYFERSWIVYNGGHPDYNNFWIDGEDQKDNGIHTQTPGYMAYGSLSAAQLLPNVSHEIAIHDCCDGYGVLAITYKQP